MEIYHHLTQFPFGFHSVTPDRERARLAGNIRNYGNSCSASTAPILFYSDENEARPGAMTSAFSVIVFARFPRRRGEWHTISTEP
jgi:hypothetical protein